MFFFQTKLEAMEARNTKLRAELSNVKSENAALKSRLDAGISKAKVENSEMKTRLSPETKQGEDSLVVHVYNVMSSLYPGILNL